MRLVVAPATTLRCPCCGQAVDGLADPRPVLDMLALPPIERRIADRLVTRFGRWVLDDALVSAMYDGRVDGGPDNTRNNLRVRLYHLRLRLSGTKLVLETAAGRGSGGRRLRWRPEQEVAA